VIWNEFGFQYVFLLGMVIALTNFFVARLIKLPKIVLPTPAPVLQETIE